MEEFQPPTLLWKPSPDSLALSPGETQAFSFDLDLPSSRITQLVRILSLDEALRSDRFHQERDRRRFIAARACMRMILGRCVKRDAADLEFQYGSHGKPALRDGLGLDRIRFNMSCSHGLGLLSVQLDEDIGVDVEYVRLLPDALAIAKRLFAPEEHRTLCSLQPSQLSEAFFRYWTRKEAVVKSIGLGLSYPVKSFVLPFEPGPSPEKVAAKPGEQAAGRWLIPVPEPSPGYVAALATAGSPFSLNCWSWIDP